MLAKIAAFEVRYQLRAPLFLVGTALFFLLTFGSVTIDQIQIGGKGNVNINSPFAILQTLAIMSVFGIFIVIAFVANVVIRDDETGFAGIIRSTSITKRDYLIGRFVGASFVAFLVMAAVPLAMLIGSWMPWLDPDKVGAFRPGDYLYALFFFALPTLLMVAAGFFALATLTRSLMWTYVGAIAFLVLFFTMRALFQDPQYDTISALADPFGIGALSIATKYWTAQERNTQLPEIAGLLLANRVIWIAVAMGVFGLAYSLFRFEGTSGKGKARQKGKPEPAPDAARPVTVAQTSIAAGTSQPAPAPNGRAAGWRQFMALARFDMAFVFKSPAFFVLLAIGIFNSIGSLVAAKEFYGVEVFPVTRVMIQALDGAFTLIPLIIAIYYAGELVWRDRDRKMHEIVDATPAPDWAFALPKIMAIVLVLAATFMVAIATGAIFQWIKGYTNFEWQRYLVWFLLPGVIGATLLAVLAIFVQALVPHKFIGWAVMLVYLVATITLNVIGFEHNLYNYADTSRVPTSDMNGLGRFWIGRAWFQVYWLAFAGMLLVFSHLMWRRGVETRLAPRFARLGKRLKGAPGLALATFALIWIGTGGFIFYNTNVLNTYVPGPDREERLAQLEKDLLPFEKLPQPKIVDVTLAVDLHPNEARAVTHGTYKVENKTTAPLTEFHVRWAEKLVIDDMTMAGAMLKKEYKDYNYRIYSLNPPMAPGESRDLKFVTTLQERGFPNSYPLSRIVSNGTFLNNMEITPVIGMGREFLLQDRSKRRKHGLPPELRMPKLEDPAASAVAGLRADSTWVTADITVSTDADQIPIAPGTTVSDVIANGRHTVRSRTEAPILHFFSVQSARYEVRKDKWNDVNLAVYYQPGHEYNVQRMLDAMKSSLAVFTTRFSPYQFKQARIQEFPAYEDFAQSFANTIPYSEGIGFIQNQTDPEKIDMVTYVTAHEIGHQWWAHQVIGADQQGSPMLSETFAQYSALLVMEKLYGKEQIRRFLKFELDRYLRSRGGEAIEELPLARVENQPYIYYRKGAISMFWLKEAIGEAAVNRALQRLINQYAFKNAPYPSTTDFLTMLREEAGPQHEALIKDLFENITLYDMKATDAIASKRADGKYDVRFTVEGRKLYADGKGRETEAPLDEPFEIGVFTAEPGKKDFKVSSVLLFERRNMKSGKQTFTVTVDKLPTHVGVDPYNKRIDRNSDDNVTKVEMEGKTL
jgi:aminopeptidase N